jgi:hypothetical protein
MPNRRIKSKRITGAAIVESGPIVVFDDDPDLFLYDLNKITVKKRNFTSTENAIAQPPVANAGTLGAVSQSSNAGIQNTLQNLVEQLDVVDLTDIENIEYYQYYDQVSKLVKYKVVIKIRNSSSKKNNVSGVDARVYNPNA